MCVSVCQEYKIVHKSYRDFIAVTETRGSGDVIDGLAVCAGQCCIDGPSRKALGVSTCF